MITIEDRIRKQRIYVKAKEGESFVNGRSGRAQELDDHCSKDKNINKN